MEGLIMKLKKVLVITLAGLMAASTLAGCSSNTGNSGNADTNAASGTTDGAGNENRTPAGDSGEKVTITFMCSGVKSTTGEDFRLDTLPRLVKEKFPNVDLEVTMLPDDQYYTALKTKLATGEAPDILWVQPRYAGVNATYALAEAGYLADLSDLNAIKLVGTGIDSFTYKGVSYGIPCGVTFLGTYYNKDVFEQNGLEVPTNWEEFIHCCEVLQSAGIQPVVMGDKDMYVMQFGLYQLAANMIYPQNGSYDDQLRSGEAKFTDPGTWDEVIKRYAELYDKGYIQKGSLGLGIAQAQQKFVDGQAAMIFDGTFNTQALVSDAEGSFESGFFPFPGNDAGDDLYTAGAPGAGPAIYSQSKNVEICKEILEYWFDGESELYKEYETCGKFNSTHKGAYVNPLYDSFMELYADGKSWYWCNQAWPAGTENEMETLFGELIGGIGTTPEKITEGMQRKFEELLR